MDWSKIRCFHRNPPKIKINRSPTIQQEYNVFLSNPNNITDLEHSLFKTNSWELRPNDFPYNFTDDTKCYVLWSQLPLNYDGIEYIIQTYYDFQDYIYFINEKNNKSIPSIFHAHIFIK